MSMLGKRRSGRAETPRPQRGFGRPPRLIRTMIRHEGITALYITHSSTDAASLADRMEG